MFEEVTTADEFCASYLDTVIDHIRRIQKEERSSLDAAARLMAKQISEDRLVHVFGPGGHSNLATQELFFRAGGLMHMNAILDEGTLLSNGALRSMAIERTPGYGRIVIENQCLEEGDLLILVNAYGINSALIDAALTAREKGVTLIGISSRDHAQNTKLDHPARHPTKQNLTRFSGCGDRHQGANWRRGFVDSGCTEYTSAISTFTNATALNTLVIRTIVQLRDMGVQPPIWRSGNAPGGDEANGQFLDRFRERVRAL